MSKVYKIYDCTCKNCGEAFKSERLDKGTDYCSRSCHTAHRRQHRIKTTYGYWMAYQPDHPSANKRGRVQEHRLIAECWIGRYLRDDEVVHHIDEDRGNNNPSNLIVMPRGWHVRYHKQMSRRAR